MKSLTIIFLLVLAYCAHSEATSGSGQRCRMACHRAYMPVCGELTRAGKRVLCTFPNKCVLERTRCVNNQDWRILRESACKQPSRVCEELLRSPK